MGDFASFRKMITPVIIEIIFYIGAIICVIAGLIMLFYLGIHGGFREYVWKGLLTLFLGPLLVRIYCEILIVFFRINETLTEIKHLIERQGLGTGPREAA
jgi:NADH:ubiquinone oxidoreductase subunit 6 (subunit J)